jgi:hypothetical protein
MMTIKIFGIDSWDRFCRLWRALTVAWICEEDDPFFSRGRRSHMGEVRS